MIKEAAKTKSSSNSVLAKVAKKANVSLGTVSRVFNNSELIPEPTRSRVMAAARELRFRPRVGVRAPKVALITEPPHKTTMGGYVNTLTQYICYALSRADATVTMITEDHIEKLSNCWIDGIICVSWEAETVKVLRKMKNLPVIWLSDEYKDDFSCIYVDCQATGRMAGDYLVSQGHRKIAVIHDIDYTGHGRLQGFADAMTAGGIPLEGNLLRLPNTQPLHLAVKQILDQGCTAVWVTGEDLKVLEVNWLLQQLAGKRVPEDISVMGFENPGISEFLCPSLTTISCPLRNIAEEAVKLALQDHEAEDEIRQLRMEPVLIKRNSVATLK